MTELRADGLPARIVIDISNTIESPRTTGVQRMALELLAMLDAFARGESPLANLVPDVCLLDGRNGRLRPIGHPAMRRLERRRDGRVTGRSIAGRIETRVAEGRPGRADWHPLPNDLFLDIDAAWHSPAPRPELLAQVRAAGARSAALVFDALPLESPQWFPPASVAKFRTWLDAHVDGGSQLLTISQASADALESATGVRDPIPVIRPGTFSAPSDAVPAQPGELGRLVLMVGTVEPRKGHDTLLAALDQLGDVAPIVDVVGKDGWTSPNVPPQNTSGETTNIGSTGTDVAQRLRTHSRVRWHENASDRELDELWARTGLFLAPSRGEGFGIPVAEAVQRGIPVLCSDLPVLREASLGDATFVDVDDIASWATHVDRWRRAPSEWPRPTALTPTWEDAARQLLQAISRPAGE